MSAAQPTSVAWIGLGSNLDAPAQQLATALDSLDTRDRLRCLAASRLYRTTPVGPADQPDFCNACAAVATLLDPFALLEVLQAIERAQHRRRVARWGPRTLDLDMLAYDDRCLAHPRLSLPHPRAAQRAFVLVPLAEIAPALVLPGAGRVADLARRVDTAGVALWDPA